MIYFYISRIRVVSKEKQIAILDTIKKMDNFFKKFDTSYFTTGGSLIGAIRNKPSGMLYWDDDFDVGVFDSDLSKIKMMLQDVEFKTNFEVKEKTFGYQLKNKIMLFDEESNDGYIYDIFIYTIKDDVYRPIQDFQNEYIIDKSEVYPIKTVDFWNTKIQIPNESVKLLKRWYGDDVFDYVKKWSSAFISFGSRKITDADRVPLHLYK